LFLANNQIGTGCALIVARSFARIHETNLKVGASSIR
jgi:aconitase A